MPQHQEPAPFIIQIYQSTKYTRSRHIIETEQSKQTEIQNNYKIQKQVNYMTKIYNAKNHIYEALKFRAWIYGYDWIGKLVFNAASMGQWYLLLLLLLW